MNDLTYVVLHLLMMVVIGIPLGTYVVKGFLLQIEDSWHGYATQPIISVCGSANSSLTPWKPYHYSRWGVFEDRFEFVYLAGFRRRHVTVPFPHVQSIKVAGISSVEISFEGEGPLPSPVKIFTFRSASRVVDLLSEIGLDDRIRPL